MILEWTTSPDGRPALVSRRQEYDAFPPVDALVIDALPATRHTDREAMAAYLAFGRWASGEFSVPEPLSPVVAEAIEVDASPIRLRPRDVVLTPRAAAQGRHRIAVRLDLPTTPTDERALAVVPSTRAEGVLAADGTLVVPSNAFILDAVGTLNVRARLAVAVLFAADLEADVLAVTGVEIPALERTRLSALLHAVNLELDL